MGIEMIVVLTSVSWLILAGLLAHWDCMFWPSQMQGLRYPEGFPFVANGAVWGNLLIIPFVLFIVGKYADEWNGRAIYGMLALGMMLSYSVFQFVYLRGKFPDSLAGGGLPISTAGWMMMIYTGAVLAALGLFYFFSKPTPSDILWVLILLAVYIPIANHLPLQYLRKYYYMPWCPNVFAEETSPLRFIIGGEIAVVVVTIIKLLL